jgi:type IX secretion system PorP/SprF family membrane protein
MKKLLFTGIILILGTMAFAQQKPLFTQYMYNGLAVNPGYAGSQPQVNATSQFRRQWTNVEGSPTTGLFTVHTALKKRAKKNGLGIMVLADQVGVHRQVEFTGIYSYRFHLNRKSILSMGLQASVNNIKSNYADLNIKQGDPVFGKTTQKTDPNFGFGLYYYSKSKAYVGASVPYILKNRIVSGDISTTTQESRFYLLTGGFVFNYSRSIKIKPSAMVRIEEGSPLTFDISANLILKETYFFGLTYRNIDAVALLMQWQINKHIQVGYAYDLTTSKLNNYSRGSHELMVNYRLNLSRELCPSYF